MVGWQYLINIALFFFNSLLKKELNCLLLVRSTVCGETLFGSTLSRGLGRGKRVPRDKLIRNNASCLGAWLGLVGVKVGRSEAVLDIPLKKIYLLFIPTTIKIANDRHSTMFSQYSSDSVLSSQKGTSENELFALLCRN